VTGEREDQRSSQLTLQYVMAELFRNVIQHSEEELGAVTGAQLNDKGRDEGEPKYQVVVADNGRGIRASLQDQHWDLDTDEVALERALWPHFSRAFPFGRTGGERNAGLGLFYVSELAKALGGRMLLASGAASVFIDSKSAERQTFFSVGYPGTLVAFEVPAKAPRDFGDVFEEIGKLADQRTPRRLVQERLRYEPAPQGAATFVVSLFLENNDEAARLAASELIPRLVRKEAVALDFVNVRLCTQSFAHALLYEPLRISWATRTPIHVLNAQPVVRSALQHVEMYSQSG
jgi:signal transduction histidine kinase